MPPDRAELLGRRRRSSVPAGAARKATCISRRSAPRSAASASSRFATSTPAGRKPGASIWPMAISYFDAALILVAWCETREAFRHFRVDRIETVERTARALPAPARGRSSPTGRPRSAGERPSSSTMTRPRPIGGGGECILYVGFLTIAAAAGGPRLLPFQVAMPLSPAKPSLDVAEPAAARAAAGGVVDFRLDNGMTVVVIPDHRAPVVTHMVWYRNGSADDPPGKSGIAHFLEHLMFKGTKAHPKGEFSKRSPRSAARRTPSPATTTPPISSASPRSISAELMEFEADRMTGLTLTDEVVAPERDVVLEERRMHCDADPGAQLNEAVQATLFTHHPYGTPIIGWGARDRGPRARGRARLLRALLHAGERDPDRRRRRRAGRGARLAERITARSARAATRRSAAGRGSRSRSPAPRRRHRREGRAAELAALLSRPALCDRRARRVRSARGARPSHRRRPDRAALPQAGGGRKEGGRRRRLLHGLGARRHALLPLRHARHRRRLAGSRRRVRSRARRLARRRRRRRRARARQDPARRRGDLRAGQPVRARALVRRLARHRPDDRRRAGMAAAHRGGDARRT